MLHRELRFLTLLVLLCQHGVKAVDLITCEGETASLTCAQGTINVLSANYGRTDRTTCSTGRSAGQLSNVQCIQSTSLSVLTTQCDGKQSCSIVVRNTVFTDPCPGTYKYLYVSYKCILPPPPPPPTSAPTTNLVTCESETAHLSCDQGTINVLSANYGRTDRTTCSTGRSAGQLSNVQCTQSTSLSVLTTQCDGKQSCSIVVRNTVFTDPCPGTYKYLYVSYKCILPPPPPPPPSAPTTNLVTCESETAHLSCAQGTINVLSANYGRTDSATCSTGRPAHQLSNVQCTQSTSLSVLTTQCDGKQSCSIVVRNTVFTDPCPGTYKYLYVSYKCILPPPPSAPTTNLVTCESETAHLSCDQGTINVLSANYGRTDSATCSTGRPAHQLSNVQCTQSTSLSVLTTQCDGKQSCSIVVRNTVFTDPCPGTYKYLYVSYKCILPTPPPPPSAPTTNLVTCESGTAHLSCAQGTIKVLSANYGRTDSTTCSTGRPAHQLSNVQCTQSTSLSVLTTQCDGKQSCSIVVRNTVFTDPCPGTYKYLYVSYECILPPPPPPPPSAPTTNLVTCESETAHLSCAQGTINVLSANYGRTDSATCSTGRPAGQLSNVQCTQSTSLSVLTTQCDGKQSCSIVVRNTVFTDPCPGTYKYLYVSYKCILPPPPSAPTTNLVTCESETAHLSCDQGTINVLSANYGRTDSATCSTGRPAHQLSNVQCTQSTSLSVLTTQCDGKQNCFIVVGNAVFTDPCPGTYKYLYVSYKCILPPPPTSAPSTNLVTCESETAPLSCAQGTINVLSANYGRTDRTTCSTGRPAGQLSNVQCTQSTSLSVLTTQCDGKPDCSISVNNAVFGDPCVGTYKYLIVSYTCVPKSIIICQDKSRTITCERRRRLYIHFANYGRRDTVTCPYPDPTAMSSICISSETMTLQLRCNGKKNCHLRASNSNFIDRCPHIHKYLEVSYSCE